MGVWRSIILVVCGFTFIFLDSLHGQFEVSLEWANALLEAGDGGDGDLLYLVEANAEIGEWREAPAASSGAGWYPVLLWELGACDDRALFKEAALACAAGLVGVGAELSEGRLRGGTAGALLAWTESTWQKVPEELLERFLNELETRWIPTAGAFWHYSEARELEGDGLAGGWSGKYNTHAASLIEVCALLELSLINGWWEWEARALSHINFVVNNHLRTDGSTVEVIALTAEGVRACADRAYSSRTTVARSHAEMLLGLGRVVRLTHDIEYLHAFERMYGYFKNNLSANGLPFWDLGWRDEDVSALSIRFEVASGTLVPFATDSGAAAITALALMEMVRSVDEALAWRYFEEVSNLLQAIDSVRNSSGSEQVSGPWVGGVHGRYPGETCGDGFVDYCYIRAGRLLRAEYNESVGVDKICINERESRWRVSDPSEWEVTRSEGFPFLRLVLDEEANDGSARICLIDTVVYDAVKYSLLTWPDERFKRDVAYPVIIFGYKDRSNYGLLQLHKVGGSRLVAIEDGIERTLLEIPNVITAGPAFHEVDFSLTEGILLVEVDGEEWIREAFPVSLLRGKIGFGATGSYCFGGVEVRGLVEYNVSSSRTNWNREHFPNGFALPAWDGSDPDGDGVCNLFEYVQGTDPREGTDGGQPLRIASSGDGLQLEWSQSVLATDVEVQLQSSVDGGQTWEAAGVEQIPSNEEEGRVAARVAANGSRVTLFRLSAESEPLE
jgi:hypothetical protein